MANDSFLTRHLHDAREGYFEHLFFAWKVGFKLVWGGAAAILHGAFPFVFCSTGSRVVEEIYADIQKRRAESSAAKNS